MEGYSRLCCYPIVEVVVVVVVVVAVVCMYEVILYNAFVLLTIHIALLFY